MDRQESKRTRQIRARSSYVLFQELYEFLEGGASTVDILRRFHDILDGRHAFGSQTNAGWQRRALSGFSETKAELALKHKGGHMGGCGLASHSRHLRNMGVSR